MKVAALCLAASVAGALLRQSEASLALVLTLCATLSAAALLAAAGEPIVSLFRELIALIKLDSAVFSPLFKLLAIALTVRIGSAFCRDASQSALAAVLESAGAFCALSAAAPLLRAVVRLVEGWL